MSDAPEVHEVDPTEDEAVPAAGDAEEPAAEAAAEADEPAPDDDEAVAASAPGEVHPDHVRALEAIVLVATEPVPSGLLAQLLEIPVGTVVQLCQKLAEAYDAAGHGFQLAQVAGGWRFQTHPDVAPYVERFVLEGQAAKLSAAALETLAIVAYKQPLSRAQIAAIRGVDPDTVLRTLVARGYVAEVARDAGPGNAVLYGTTPTFLEKLGLASLSDLPALAGFVPGADVVEALEQGLRVDGDRPDPASRPDTTEG